MTAQRKMKMADGTAMNAWTIQIKSSPRTSQRCRATHDVPYTLRCVLDASHTWQMVATDASGTVGMVTMHRDKNGDTW
jgi:hypothetical protein